MVNMNKKIAILATALTLIVMSAAGFVDSVIDDRAGPAALFALIALGIAVMAKGATAETWHSTAARPRLVARTRVPRHRRNRRRDERSSGQPPPRWLHCRATGGGMTPRAVILTGEGIGPLTAGGKGSALDRLVALDVRVPSTGVITTTAYEEFEALPEISTYVASLKAAANARPR